MESRVKRPELTLPEVESAALSALYHGATAILEYGSGGSTVLAAALPEKRIFTVESDAAWLGMMQEWFAQNPPVSPPELHHGDVGPTKRWGYPASTASFLLWPNYAQTVWDRADFAMPEVVLVDGRFRLACMLTVAWRMTRPLVMLVDDYSGRPGYHEAESMLGAPQMIGRLARFDLVPGLIPMTRLHLVVDSHLRAL